MEKYFELSLTATISIILTAIGIYAAIIVFTRIFGKRSFSKMSSFDFAMTVAVGSVIATTVLSSSVSLPEGIIGLLSLYALQLFLALLRRNSLVQNTIDNKPLLLMDGSKVIDKNLLKARVTMSDLRAKLREANVLESQHIRAVIFETTGDISVLHSANSNTNLEKWLLDDVKR